MSKLAGKWSESIVIHNLTIKQELHLGPEWNLPVMCKKCPLLLESFIKVTFGLFLQ